MSLFYSQLKALVYRNYLLKKNNKQKTFQEFFIPFYLILIIFFLRFAGKTKFYPAEDSKELGNASELWIGNPSENVIGFVLPQNEGDEIISKVMNGPIFGNGQFQFQRFNNANELDEYNDKNSNLAAGVIFEDNLFTYTIRINGTEVTDPEADPIGIYGKSRVQPPESLQYLNKFLYLQSQIDSSIISLKTNKPVTIDTNINSLSKPSINYSTMSGGIGSKIYSMYMNFIFLCHIILIVTFIVGEKEKRIREGMLMSGVHPALFWLSWEIIYFVIIFITSIFISVFLVLTKSYVYINPILLFIVILLYGLSNCGIGFVFSTFFKKAKTANSYGGSIISAVCVSYLAISYLDKKLKVFFSLLLSPVAMGNIFDEISKKEDLNEKTTLTNVFKSDIGLYILILIINNILYFGLAVLFEYLFDEYSTFKLKKHSNLTIMDNENTGYEQDIQEDSRKNEPCSVEISNISKEFEKDVSEEEEEEDESSKGLFSKNKKKTEKFLAVNHVSFKVYKDEIFAILGHNGAGKTTLLQIMIGLINASGGNVYFDGNDISKDTTVIRRDFGVCPQTNILFDELTVEDHIKIFSMIKNTKVDVDEILKEVDLEQKKNDKVLSLSGGQKRKLCVALAIIGDPKYIFLDEPTTGLDPLSRRKIWDLLTKKRNGRTIFLTTHYMDEADILADRKLILSHGKIRCLGTSLYLKNHFNMQYSLDIETSSCNEAHQIVRKYIPESQYEIDQEKQIQNSSIEMGTWKLPISSTSQFPELFNELESTCGEDHLIKRYALSMPTLEELFIRLEDEETVDSRDYNNQDDTEALVVNTNEELPKLEKVEGISAFEKMLALIKFRMKIFFHNKSFSLSALVLPVICALFSFVIIKFMDNVQYVTFEAAEISPNLYSNSVWNINSGNTTIPNFVTTYESVIGDVPFTEHTDEKLNEIGKTVDKEPYFVSSVSGSLENDNYKFKVYYNESMAHSLPVTLNALANTILAENNINEKIVTKSHPFPYGNYQFVTYTNLIVGIYVGAALIAGVAIYGPLVVRERVNQLLQQLQLNGVSRTIYWCSSLISDCSLSLITCFLVILIGIIFQPDTFLHVYIIIILIVSIILWDICVMIYQYVLSFMFNKEDSANSFIALLDILPAYIGVTVVSIINASQVPSSGQLFSTVTILIEVILSVISPPYAIISILNTLFTLRFFETVTHMEMDLITLLKFNSGITPLIITIAVCIPLYYFILLKLDQIKNQTNAKDIYEPIPEIKEKNEKIIKEGDEDVYHEFRNVQKNYNELPICALQVSKEYPVNLSNKKEEQEMAKQRTDPKFGEVHLSKYKKRTFVRAAVDDISFGVNQHECFGLLGPNGAGKSTTLNMITSTIPQTTGKIYYNGVETHVARLNDISLGYCPQNDTYWKELTIREHIEFFLKIRGYSPEKIKEYTTQYINCCNLEEHQNKRASKLSGGTKRKLCLLMAICGYPSQILLDEPTAGMDPSTRRYVWNIIKQTKKENDSAFIMTTHSMEEAENLCDRIGILINGRLVCIGSPEHIKMKYGNTYNLEIQSQDIDRFHQTVIEEGGLLGSDYKKEIKSYDRMNYEVVIQQGVGKIFECMERCKAQGLISDYSFSQTTLEQVFINFAKLQVTAENSN